MHTPRDIILVLGLHLCEVQPICAVEEEAATTNAVRASRDFVYTSYFCELPAPRNLGKQRQVHALGPLFAANSTRAAPYGNPNQGSGVA